MTALLPVILGPTITEALKFIGEAVGPDWHPFVTKAVNYLINYGLLQTGAPTPLQDPVLGSLATPIAALITTFAGGFVHDVTTGAAKSAGISSPTVKFSTIKVTTEKESGRG